MEGEDSDEDFSDWIEEDQRCFSLFEEVSLPTSRECLAYDSENYGFDVLSHAARLGLDVYGYMRMVNYIRTQRKPETARAIDGTESFLRDDKYLKPVLEDDPLLQIDFDEAVSKISSNAKGKRVSTEEADRIADLEAQLQSLHAAFAMLQEKARGELLDNDEAGPSQPKPLRDDDSHYFRSYAANEIHESMLKDAIRTDAYRDFILKNPALFEGRTVLDVGCGTGILSLFAAEAGARKVYAVEASQVARQAIENIKENGFQDRISVLHGRIEDVELPEQVDIIISEWMGYFLLYESMLDSVLHARDRFLKPGGLMAPSQCSLLLAGVDDADFIRDKLDFWTDVYGFKMSAMRAETFEEAVIATVQPDSLVTDVVPLQDFHVAAMAANDVDFSATFVLRIRRRARLRVICAWFDTFFTGDGRLLPTDLLFTHQGLRPGETAFTTGPQGRDTHWSQTLFLLKKPVDVSAGDELKADLDVRKSDDNSRELVVTLTIEGHEEEAQTWFVR